MILTVSIVLLIFASVAVHELGHAVAMRRLGVQVDTVSLLGFPGLGTVELPIKHSLFPGTRWVLHPLILGAYVKPDEEDIKRLSSREKDIIAGAGPLANVCFSIVLLALAAATFGVAKILSGVGTRALALQVALAAGTLGVVVLSWMLAWFLWRCREFVTAYLLLPLGFVFLAYFAYGFVTRYGLYGVGSMTETTQILHQGSAKMADKPVLVQVGYAALMSAVVSMMLGLGNLMPLMPLDGGHMLRERIRHQRLKDMHAYATIPIVLALTLLPLAKDLSYLAAYLWRLVF